MAREPLQITVLGKGVFGRAMGSLLEANQLPHAYVDIDLPMQAPADLVLLTVPTQFLRAALIENKPWFKPATVFVNCAKGVEEATHLLPFQITAAVVKPAAYYTLVGPSFASEVVAQQPTLVSLGYNRRTHVARIKGLLQTPYFRIQETRGYAGLELAAAFKNVYAIICGYAFGLGYRQNTRAKLITLALGELAQLEKAMGFPATPLVAPGFVGDLILTCSSNESRNFRFGENLATLETEAALARVNATVEGYYTSHSLQALRQTYNVQLPLALLTATVIDKGPAARDDFHDFIATR